jgi:hypothetical protein
VRVFGVELGDTMGEFADTITDGMDGSCECEWDELELVML